MPCFARPSRVPSSRETDDVRRGVSPRFTLGIRNNADFAPTSPVVETDPFSTGRPIPSVPPSGFGTLSPRFRSAAAEPRSFNPNGRRPANGPEGDRLISGTRRTRVRSRSIGGHS